jgi:DNA-directed RNA polymerase subunit beta'
MKKYTFQNTLVSKKQLKQILSWTFTNYGSVQGSLLADELKYLGFKYSTKAGISISIEDLRIPPIKNSMLEKSNKEIITTEQTCLKGNITEVERFQKVIDTWNITSETLKDEVVSYFRNYDPLNSVYMMAFSGARGNLSQVRQLVGMRGLMSDPNGEIMDLPIKQNFREGLTITDYLMSGYGARKGIVDTALKTANSGYLTRRLIDVAQDIIIREKDCLTKRSIVFVDIEKDSTVLRSFYDRILGRILNQTVYNPTNREEILFDKGIQITPSVIKALKQYNVTKILVRSPLSCNLNRSICQKCYGWNLANENLVDLGEAVGIIAGQSIGEPGTQLTMRTFHTGGIFTAGSNQQILSSVNGNLEFSEFLKTTPFRTNRGENVLKTENSGSLIITLRNNDITKIEIPSQTLLFVTNKSEIKKDELLGQLIESSKQTKIETKTVLSDLTGEILIKKGDFINTDSQIAWVLAGQLFDLPIESYLNINSTYKILKYSFISRTKLINKHPGIVKIVKDQIDLSKTVIEILSNSITFPNTKIKKFSTSEVNENYLLEFDKINQFKLNRFSGIETEAIVLRVNEPIGQRITNVYDTNTGGTPYFFTQKSNIETDFLWLPEESHIINRDSSVLKVEDSEYVSENYEILTDLYSKIPGIISIIEKNNILQEISIKPGFLYKVKNFSDYDQKIFYPGEIIFNELSITELSISEIINTRTGPEILIRPLILYNVPRKKSILKFVPGENLEKKKEFNIKELFSFKNSLKFNIKNKEKIKTNKNLTLVEQNFEIDLLKKEISFENLNLEILTNINAKNELEFLTSEKICLDDYIPNQLRKSEIKINLLVQNNQFINSSSILGYLEIIAQKTLDLIKVKTRFTEKRGQKNKKLFLTTNNDCVKISLLNNPSFETKNLNELINDPINIDYKGRIISKTINEVVVQKGRPYFFPKGAKVRCQTGNLIEKNDNIGQLIFEKEITGDIVQGLPRVEEILEARKGKKINKTSLIKKTDLNPNFKFIKIGTSLAGEENINLHNLLSLYFQYYITRETLYEATYRSIKKVQGLILNLIQSVYQSQGVTISDKHLEVIIKQMTTKVKIAHEGDTPLLPNELIDLQQIKYINESIENDEKQPAFYHPVLLGITRASLNTESFISAASFQETTRVLTKAAIEGKVDWLRGLKENVIIGRLIPAGTGFNSYSDLSDSTLKLVKNVNKETNELKQFFNPNN